LTWLVFDALASNEVVVTGIVTTNGFGTGQVTGTLTVSVVMTIEAGGCSVQEQCVVVRIMVLVISPVAHGSTQVAL
jgi:hypothetical protein